MLKKLLPALVVAALGLGPIAQAQTQPTGWRPCGAAELQELYFSQHPQARREYQAILEAAAAMPTQQRQLLGNRAAILNPADTLIDVTVPVVVHVLYYDIPVDNSNAPTNITDRQINDAIAIATRDWHRVNPDTSDIIPIFKSRIANMGFRFRLAKLDPNGNCTTGITRHYSNETNFGRADVTGIVYWPKDKYLNVWVTDDISSGAGGYTFGGALGCPTNDGIVLRRSQFGPNSGCTANLCTRSLTHEIGHYFGLNHTWGQTNTPGVAGNCGVDDGVADTPNTMGVTGGNCPTTMAGCVAGTIANVQNYMDYADCEKMFTAGQKAVVRAGILNSSCRRTLVSAANLIATGTNDGYVSVPCAPIADFQPNKTVVCAGDQVKFRSYTYNINSSGGNVTYAWTFPGGTPATSGAALPVVVYNTPGIYDVTLRITNNGGTNSHTTNQIIQVTGPASGEAAPFTESFENPTFPLNYAAPSQRNYVTMFDSPANYTLANGWVRRTASSIISAADGNAYLIATNRSQNTAAGRPATSTLITPNINLQGVTTPVLSFSDYYVQNSATATVSLVVSYSLDCGATWTPFTGGTFSNSQLTIPSPNDIFPATPSEWRNVTIPIPAAFYGRTSFRVRFQTSHNSTLTENPLYLDKVQITGPLGTHAAALAQRNISVYPNPLTHETAVRLDLAAATQVQVSLTDVLGREVLALPAKTYTTGAQNIALPTAAQGLKAGVYVVRIVLDGETYTSKLAVQ